MHIVFTEPEIKKIITDHITTQGFVMSDRKLTVELTAGRGVNGHSATVEISDWIEDEDDSTDELDVGNNTKEEPFIEKPKQTRKKKTAKAPAEPVPEEKEEVAEEEPFKVDEGEPERAVEPELELETADTDDDVSLFD